MRLFDRFPSGVTLTEPGRRLHEIISASLGAIQRGVAEVQEISSDEQVVVACSHDISHFVLRPRYKALCAELGDHVWVRILHYDQDITNLLAGSVADVVCTWNNAAAMTRHHVAVMKEAVAPVASPAYADIHAGVLSGPVTGWGALTLVDYTRPNEGWASWEDWFTVAGTPDYEPRRLGLDSYAYVLEAAGAGRGVALGWQGYVDRYLAQGALIALGEGFVDFDRYCFAVLTEKGRGNPSAHQCLTFLDGIPCVEANWT